MFLGGQSTVDVQEIDIRNYAKFILKEAPDAEKRELLSCLTSKIILKEKIISLSQISEN